MGRTEQQALLTELAAIVRVLFADRTWEEVRVPYRALGEPPDGARVWPPSVTRTEPVAIDMVRAAGESREIVGAHFARWQDRADK